MADYPKHREEKIKVNCDFSLALNTGDSVASVSSVTVHEKVDGAWTDVSSEFGTPSGTQIGDTVDLWLSAAASATVQDAGDYRVKVEVVTTNSEILVLTPTLAVTDVAQD